MQKSPFLSTSWVMQRMGLLAIGVMMMGALLSLILPAANVDGCTNWQGIGTGLLQFVPACWFHLGIGLLMVTPAVTLVTVLVSAIKQNDFRLVAITIAVGLLLLFALLP